MIDDDAIRRLRARLTPAQQAELAARLRGRGGGASPIPRRTAPGPALLSFGQQRLWLLDQLRPGSTQYNLPLAVRIRGELDTGALEAALGELVRRHEALRTVFPLGPDGAPVQQVLPPGPLALPTHDLSGLAPADAEAELQRLVDDQVVQPFAPLGEGPLIRARLIRTGPADHALLLTLHHIVTDGWSHGVLVRDVLALYRDFARGRAPSLPPLPLQYADYAAWQRGEAGGPRMQAALAFWRAQLTPPPPPLELPTGRGRAAHSDGAAVAHVEVWPAELLEAIRGRAAAQRATLFMVLLAGFEALVLRTTEQRDFLIGTPVAHRERPELEALIGFFVNTLVLRASPSPGQSFAALVDDVRGRALACFAHQDAPLERVVEDLALERSAGRSVPFRVFYAHQNAPMPPLAAGGLELSLLEPRARRAQFDLTLVTGELAGGLRVEVVADAARFDRSAPARIAGHLRTLLEAAVRAPDTALAALPVLGGTERTALLAAGHAAAVAGGGERIERRIATWAARRPEAPAVWFDGAATCYRELEQRANALADRLVAGGVGPERRVGVLVERCPDAACAVLAVLKAGAAFLLLDPDHPPERLAAQLDDARPALVVTSAALAERLRAQLGDRLPPGALVVLDRDARRPEPPATPPRTPDHLAYVLYTSGSSGRPKAVMVDHRSLAHQLAWRERHLQLAPDDRVLHTIPFTFDPAIWGLLGPLAAGAAIDLSPAGGHREPRALVALIASAGATVIDLALPALHGILALDDPPRPLDRVRFVFCGGDALDTATVERFARRFPAARLCNVYGPTEATIDATFHDCAPGGDRSWVPIGQPVASKRVYVLDPRDQLVPVGVAGELCIGGATLARGYLGRPGLTAEHFVPDPFGEPGARMYRTGDAARWLPGDQLEFLGRLDRQVKIRGMRIEPGEVEAALHQHPGVARAIVTAVEGPAGERELVGYHVPAGEPVPAAALRAFLRTRLPEPMIPRAFVALGELPVGPGGKIDVRALPAPGPAQRDAGAEYVAPRTALEAAIATRWGALLGVERVGVRDDFFLLGGHSVLAMRAAAQLRELAGVELTVRALFDHPTIEDLLASCGLAGAEPRIAGAPAEVAGAEVGAGAGPAPLSFPQDHVWRQIAAGDASLNVPIVVGLRGPLSRDAVAAALAMLVRRHDALRTTFPVRDGAAVQVVLAACDVPLVHVDLRGDPDPDAAVAQHVARWTERPFALATEPALRALLVQRAADHHVLGLVTHRLVYDGATAAILARDLAQLYEAAATGRAPALPPVAVQAAEHARRQRARLSDAVLADRRQTWEVRLGQAGGPSLVADVQAAAVPHGRAVEAVVPAESVAALEAAARQHGATMFAALLCGLAIVLHEETGDDDFVIACPMACRDGDGLEHTVGRLVNLVPVRASLWGDPDLAALLGRLRDRLLDLYTDDQALPFAALGLLDGPHGPLARARVMCNLTAAPGVAGPAGLALELPPPPEQFATEFDLALHAIADGGALRLRLGYRADRFGETRARQWLARYCELLGALAEPRGRRLSALSRAAPRRGPAGDRAHERVTIVGAGPAGLLLATQLASRGHRVDVYEAHPDPRVPAARAVRRPTINITLCERGLAALETIGLAGPVMRAAMPATRRIIHDPSGGLVAQPYGNRGEALFSVMRAELLRQLLQATERRPEVRVRFGERLVDLDPRHGELRFRNEQTGDESQVHAERIVGADGAQSTARHILQRRSRVSVAQDYAPVGYKELITAGGARADWSQQLDALHLWPRGRFMLIGLPKRPHGFSLTLHMPHTGAQSFESLATSADVLALFEREFRDVLPHTPALASEFFSSAPNAVVTVRCSAWTAAGKVTLLGDAAHAMAPYYGQGTNAAFEDCATLVACLDEVSGAWPAAIEEFARRRRPEADAICTIALEHARELSEAVADPRFQLRKAIERKLNQLFPDRFRSLYQMVSFSTLPYSTALEIEERQRRVVDDLLRLDGLARDLDGRDATRALAAAVAGLPARWPAPAAEAS